MAKIESEERKTVDVSNPYNKDVGTQTDSCNNHLNSNLTCDAKQQRSSKHYSGFFAKKRIGVKSSFWKSCCPTFPFI